MCYDYLFDQNFFSQNDHVNAVEHPGSGNTAFAIDRAAFPKFGHPDLSLESRLTHLTQILYDPSACY